MYLSILAGALYGVAVALPLVCLVCYRMWLLFCTDSTDENTVSSVERLVPYYLTCYLRRWALLFCCPRPDGVANWMSGRSK